MENVLKDLKFSVYETVEDTTGRVEDWNYIAQHLLTTKDPAQKKAITELREENELHGHSDKYNDIKREKLNVWCPAGILHREKGNTHVVEWSGFVQIDIDQKDNEGEDIREKIDNLLYNLRWKVWTLVCSQSSGGKGCYLLFRCYIKSEEDYNFYVKWLYLTIVTETGLIPDKRALDSIRLRFLSIDENLFINPEAETLLLPDEVRFCISGIKEEAPASKLLPQNKTLADEATPVDVWPEDVPEIKILYPRGGVAKRFKEVLKDIGKGNWILPRMRMTFLIYLSFR